MKNNSNVVDFIQKKINRRKFVANTLKSVGFISVLKPKFLFETSLTLLGDPNSLLVKPITDTAIEKPKLLKTVTHTKHIINFYNIHTGEWLKKCHIPKNGKIDAQLKEQLDYLLRDFRTKEIYPIDSKLYSLIVSLLLKMDVQKPVHIVSGYRSLKSNQFLRQYSNGVAKKSFHTKGKALDFFIEGIAHKRIARTALDMKKGGVGRYRSFIHIDTGPFRTWT